MRTHVGGAWRLACVALVAGMICAGRAGAQAPGPDQSTAASFGAAIADQRIYAHALLDQFEGRLAGASDSFRWDGQAWAGTDTNRLWLKSEGFANAGGVVGDGTHEALYDRPISTYFDLQAGVRYDIDSGPSRGWAALGIQGLTAYWFDVEATAYLSDAGHLAARLRGSYDLLITQRLILQPEIELDLYSRPDPARGTGAGLSDLDAGLRLRYEITRKLAPYLGVTYDNRYGTTATYARHAGETLDNLRLAVGIRTWL